MGVEDSTNVYVKPTTEVKIRTETQEFNGRGLKTSQDFKEYEILNLEGVFDIEEDEEQKR